MAWECTLCRNEFASVHDAYIHEKTCFSEQRVAKVDLIVKKIDEQIRSWMDACDGGFIECDDYSDEEWFSKVDKNLWDEMLDGIKEVALKIFDQYHAATASK